ncbi:c-type cytochrome [Amaricoccus solimangrovi]|uniref:Cytochrome c n=1 Tax=Amaricoccus solimangrovi TaxID=2589815 RepID=A0A501WX29_9RHOB|nr:cytochrome c [Amaricoccus solimangrovi]TPE53272.1 cytochrome c [Amaricoccus solimangrovi]
MTAVRLPLAALALVLAGGAAGAADLDGAALFEQHCSACHASGGVGTPGLAPPLDRPEFWQALGDNAPKYIAGVVTQGLNMPITVRGEMYAGTMMPPVPDTTDDELAAISTWVLDTLGKTDKTVTPDDIAGARDGVKMADVKALRPASE